MNLQLHKSRINKKSFVEVTGSKSESNRLLLLQALFPGITIENLSNSDDTKLMRSALKSKSDVIDIHHAGTAMRFLTAYFSIQEGRDILLTGSKRMKERPISILVDALRHLGAEISYSETQGFPPLRIRGKNIQAQEVSLNANVSSQYISALLLIAPRLTSGLKLTLNGKITSVPYIKMTLALLDEIGVTYDFTENTITIKPIEKPEISKTLIVESDWSSASYFYSIAALADVGTEIKLSAYKQKSLQGDSALVGIYERFGVKTQFSNNAITLVKTSDFDANQKIDLDLSNCPDIAQTITVTCLGLNMECELSGLHTLKIKETDRLEALKTEVLKLGGNIDVTDDSLHLGHSNKLRNNIAIDTYNDHRMAMAFAPLALKTSLMVNDAGVVSKSYPDFWKDLRALGFHISE